jgi:heme/copper-type cytochrome/quinol oxidase subunit 2
VPLPDLEPGTHEIEITLAAVDHSDYVIDGTIVGAATEYVVEGAVAAADVTLEIEYTGGEVVLADARPSVPLGSVVEVVLTSDVAEELHIHGYDLMVGVSPGETQRVRFTADIPGIFEVELEQSGTPVLDLTVS